MITAAGWTVEAAGSGEEALARVSGRRLRLVLLDLELPGLSGLAVAPLLRRAVVDGADLPILAHSALTGDDLDARVRAAGIDGFLPKPCSPEMLVEAIASLLRVPSAAPRRLMALFGAARFGELLRGLEAQLASAPQHLAGPERETFLHRLGGLAGTLGFASLAQTCLAREDRIDSTDAALHRRMAEARREIRALLGNDGDR